MWKKTLNITLRIIKRISVRFAFHYRISHYRTMVGQCCNRTLLDTAVTYTFAEHGTYKASTVNDTRRNEQSLFAIYLIVPFDLHDNMHSPFPPPRSSLPLFSPSSKKRNLCESFPRAALSGSLSALVIWNDHRTRTRKHKALSLFHRHRYRYRACSALCVIPRN